MGAILDAQQILSLIVNNWNAANVPLIGTALNVTVGPDGYVITPAPVENMVNGGFESGSTGWNSSNITTAQAHSGTHSDDIFYEGSVSSVPFGTAIPVANITTFGFWVMTSAYHAGSGSAVGATIHYSDATSTFVDFGWLAGYTSWTFLDLKAHCVSGKSVSYVTVANTQLSYVIDVFVDDFTLQTASAPVAPTMLISMDEFNPEHPDFQIVLINSPERVFYVAPNVQKHEIDILVQVYTKLVHYQPDDLVGANGSPNNYRAQLLSIKKELSRIFNVERFDSLGQVNLFTTINHSQWVDKKFPHGFGNEPEPLSFDTSTRVQIHWYSVDDGSTDIGTRIAYIQIMGSNLLGAMDSDWDDTDPWVELQVPKGPILEQHLLGPHMMGKFTTHDFHSLYNLLYTIPINGVGTNLYPVMVDNSKTLFSTNPASPQLVIAMEDSSGNIDVYNFINVRIKKIRQIRATTSGTQPVQWEVTFMADYIYPVPSTGV